MCCLKGQNNTAQRFTDAEKSDQLYKTRLMKHIATHTRPDADALAAAWLAQRFMFAGEESTVNFISRSWTPSSRQQFNCAVDVGRTHNAQRLLFDHKPPALLDRNISCATSLACKYLQERGHQLSHLEPLIQVVHQGDRRPPQAPSEALRRSRSEGFHALVRRQRDAGRSDEQMFEAARLWLDGYHFGRLSA